MNTDIEITSTIEDAEVVGYVHTEPLTPEEEYLQNANDQAKFDHKSAVVINEKLSIDLERGFLVKPLPIQKVKVIKDIPVENGKVDKETGAKEYDVKQEEMEIDLPIREGIIIALPKHDLYNEAIKTRPYVLGEHVFFSVRQSSPFYLVKDSLVIDASSIVARVRPDKVVANNEEKKK